jgi:predicted DNA-binding protein with PD1-like motif
MEVVPLRLQPGDDLREALEAWMGEQQEQAGCLISAVGSLSVAQLRLAGGEGSHRVPWRVGDPQPLWHPFSRWCPLAHRCGQ